VLAASGAGRAVRAGRPGPALGSYGGPGQQYPAPAGNYQQQQPWAPAPQSPQQWGGQPPQGPPHGPPQGPPPTNS